MATATIVHQGTQRLRYLIAAEGTGSETALISTVGLNPVTGTDTPDTLTDSLGSGVIKQLSKVVADGYGAFAAGAQTQAKARALWLSDLSGADPSSGSPDGAKKPTAKTFLTVRTGTGEWSVDASTNSNNPTIVVTLSGGGTAYLDIEAPGTIGA